jgi:hypothetical protein
MKNHSALSVPSVVTIKVSPKDIKRLDDPHDDSRYAYECQIPVIEAVKLPIGTANPRRQDTKRKIYREIRDSLSSSPDLFHIKNRGIWFAAERAEYDNQTGTLTLHCPVAEGQLYGVLDGGNTKAVLTEYVNELKNIPDTKLDAANNPILKPIPYVMLHVRIGVEDNLAEMAESLNTSYQLKEFALADFRGEFEELREILDKEPFGKQIAYTENEQGEYDILDVIRRLTLVCRELFPGKTGKHPVVAYASKKKCLELFLANKSQFMALRPILVDCFRLPDQLEVLLPLVSGSERFGNYKFAPRQKARLAPSLVGLPTNGLVKTWASEYQVSPAVIFPMAAALRVLVHGKKDGSINGWRQDPAKFFLKNGSEMFEYLIEAYNNWNKNVNALGKDAKLWADLYHAAYEAQFPSD